MTDEVVRLENISKIYPLLSGDVLALNNISLSIKTGEFVAIIGPSGSGKSTLLNQLGCLDVPTSGDLKIGGKSITQMSDSELTHLRLIMIGFIFQKFNLLPLLSAYENVEYPYTLKYRKRDTSGRVTKLLDMVGINEDLAKHKPSELSGGQQQRVAIARSLVNNPKILLCDEPTGNLDSKTGVLVMNMLKKLNSKGKTLIIVTHDPGIAAQADRTITIRDGELVADVVNNQ
ncbi:ABC transporter ATP-binding protein [Methanospirillum stamsii]|uniref:Lipoprotein-releasing system ATP-binding protein LolD n=1 Tax=Methanospirillum stamsii TaxID=1277351 RepID=A0A2V2N7C3_9EURY|nr:ABC transporter ATP-binding protein [Methanospirillum stamsii]PWR75942.1 lipoprotein-releasing system ATP-binding protein LolD [Methanospirillum stamsii]